MIVATAVSTISTRYAICMLVQRGRTMTHSQRRSWVQEIWRVNMTTYIS